MTRTIPPAETTNTDALIGTPSTPGVTVFNDLETIMATTGGGTSIAGVYTLTGSFALITDGSHPLQKVSPTASGTLKAVIYLDPMQGGDIVNIKVQRQQGPSTWIDDKTYSFSGVQTDKAITLTIPYTASHGVRVQAQQTAGSLRTVDYEGVV